MLEARYPWMPCLRAVVPWVGDCGGRFGDVECEAANTQFLVLIIPDIAHQNNKSLLKIYLNNSNFVLALHSHVARRDLNISLTLNDAVKSMSPSFRWLLVLFRKFLNARVLYKMTGGSKTFVAKQSISKARRYTSTFEQPTHCLTSQQCKMQTCIM